MHASCQCDQSESSSISSLLFGAFFFGDSLGLLFFFDSVDLLFVAPDDESGFLRFFGDDGLLLPPSSPSSSVELIEALLSYSKSSTSSSPPRVRRENRSIARSSCSSAHLGSLRLPLRRRSRPEQKRVSVAHRSRRIEHTYIVVVVFSLLAFVLNVFEIHIAIFDLVHPVIDLLILEGTFKECQGESPAYLTYPTAGGMNAKIFGAEKI